MSKARLVFNGDNVFTEKTLRIHKLTQEIENKIESIPWVVDNLTSESSTDALSANQWRLLQDQINELKSMWRFLSSWNCVTWLPKTEPADDPYDYRVWDYYIVNTVWATNYRPHGSYYRHWQASTAVETETVNINDWYLYDWSNWILQNQDPITIDIDSSLSTTSQNAVQNRVITNALGWKQDIINDLATIRANAALWATALQSWDNISSLNNDANYATQWYVTTAVAGKQDKLIAWNNIQIAADWKTISATNTLPNNATITINQAWSSKWDFTTDQAVAENIDLEWNILATQPEYNNLPSSKESDWNFYFIYSTSL